MHKQFIGYKGIFIHRNKTWRWQIRFQKKIKTLTIGNVNLFSEEKVKKLVDNINLKEIQDENELRIKLQEQINIFKNNIFKDKSSYAFLNKEIKSTESTKNNRIISSPNKIFNIKKENQEITYCKNLLPVKKGICSILSGKGGIGKSFLIILEALQYLYENPNNKAFLWLSEDSENDIKERIIYALFNILKIKNVRDVVSILNRFFFYGASVTPINFFENSSVSSANITSDSFNQMLEELKEYDFIVLDPFSSFFNGDENSNTEVNLFVKKTSQYSASYNKIFFILHHHGKSGKIRGAAAFRDGVRLHYSVLKKEKDSVIVEIEKDNINMQKIFGKQKKIKIFNEKLNSSELERYNTFLKELEIMFNSNIDKIEESKLIQSIKAIENISENKNISFVEKKEKVDIKSNNQIINPFNEKTDTQIIKIMN